MPFTSLRNPAICSSNAVRTSSTPVFAPAISAMTSARRSSIRSFTSSMRVLRLPPTLAICAASSPVASRTTGTRVPMIHFASPPMEMTSGSSAPWTAAPGPGVSWTATSGAGAAWTATSGAAAPWTAAPGTAASSMATPAAGVSWTATASAAEGAASGAAAACRSRQLRSSAPERMRCVPGRRGST